MRPSLFLLLAICVGLVAVTTGKPLPKDEKVKNDIGQRSLQGHEITGDYDDPLLRHPTQVSGEDEPLLGHHPTQVSGEDEPLLGHPTQVSGEDKPLLGHPTQVSGEDEPSLRHPTQVSGDNEPLLRHPTQVSGDNEPLLGHYPTEVSGEDEPSLRHPTQVSGEDEPLSGHPTQLSEDDEPSLGHPSQVSEDDEPSLGRHPTHVSGEDDFPLHHPIQVSLDDEPSLHTQVSDDDSLLTIHSQRISGEEETVSNRRTWVSEGHDSLLRENLPSVTDDGTPLLNSSSPVSRNEAYPRYRHPMPVLVHANLTENITAARFHLGMRDNLTIPEPNRTLLISVSLISLSVVILFWLFLLSSRNRKGKSDQVSVEDV